jgi:hypothetical protein
MNDTPPSASTTTARWTLIGAVAALGVAGVASLGLAPLETLLPPDASAVPRAVLLIQPMILVIAGAFLGGWAAPKLGLTAPVLEALIARRDPLPALARTIGPALLGAALVAAVLLLYGFWSEAVLPTDDTGQVTALQQFKVPLITSMLYGGLSEEVLSRWGLMAALALGAVRLGLRQDRAIWTGNALAALIFAAGHIPLLIMVMPSPPVWMIGAVLIGNIIPGLIFGWLFWRRGLEAAMLAHAGGHFMATVINIAL